MSESGFTFDQHCLGSEFGEPGVLSWIYHRVRRQETCSVTDEWKLLTITNDSFIFDCFHVITHQSAFSVYLFIQSHVAQSSYDWKTWKFLWLKSWRLLNNYSAGNSWLTFFFGLSNEWIPCCKVNATHMVASLVTTVCRLLGDGAPEVVLDQCPCVKRFQPFPYEWGWHHKKLRLQ